MNPNNYKTRSKKEGQTIIEQQPGTPARQIQPLEPRIIHTPVPTPQEIDRVEDNQPPQPQEQKTTSPHQHKKTTSPTAPRTRRQPAPNSTRRQPAPTSGSSRTAGS